MHQFSKHPWGAFLVLGGVLVSQASFATNGYFPHGVGTRNKAMAGAGMAAPVDAISIVNNPAVAALVGNRMDVGLAVFQPRRNFTTFEEGSKGENNTFTFDVTHTDSEKDLYLVPEVARTHQLQNETAFAWAFYMRTGIGTSLKGGHATFDPDAAAPQGVSVLPGTYGGGDFALDISQAYVDITWAKMWNENTSFGISAVLAAQSIEVKGTGGLSKFSQTFAANGGTMPEQLSGNGSDVNYGAGLKIGLHRKFGEQISFGIMYQSEISVGSTNDYSDLFANGGDMDIPAWFRVGISLRPIEAFSISIDVQRIFYSNIDALANPFGNIYDCPSAGFGGTDLNSCLGGRNGPGFGWNDVPIYNIGGSLDLSDSWTLLAGFSFSDQPTPIHENFLNAMLIDMTEAHYTAGVSHRLRNGHELSFSFMYTEEESLEYLNQLDPNQVILITTDQFDFQVSYSWGR